jgi:type I restriction enzyme M protein
VNLSAFIWSVADLLRGTYKPHEYGQVILPFTVLRRMDCVLERTKDKVLREAAKRGHSGTGVNPFLTRAAGTTFYNTSPMDLKAIVGDQDNIAMNLEAYVNSFSPNVKDIFARFKLQAQIDRLADKSLLYLVTEKFSKIDLHPDAVSNAEMGSVFEELIRKFAEQSNETAGEHFTPREVIRLMVNLIFAEDDEVLSNPGVVRTIYDPTAGTGGMLSVAGEWIHEHNPQARLTVFGHELNDESYAICKADMLIKGQDVSNIKPGDTLAHDGHAHQVFDYMLSNPPFGVEWKQSEKAVRKGYEEQGYNGRFGPGLPRNLRRLTAVHAAFGEEDASVGRWWSAVLYRPERVAAVYGGGGVGRERDSTVSAGERPGGGNRRAPNRDVLQHGHLDLSMDRDEQEATGAQGHVAVDRCL